MVKHQPEVPEPHLEFAKNDLVFAAKQCHI